MFLKLRMTGNSHMLGGHRGQIAHRRQFLIAQQPPFLNFFSYFNSIFQLLKAEKDGFID